VYEDLYVLNDNSHLLTRAQAIDSHVGRRLRLARELKGFSQKELAVRLQISVDALARHEVGTERILASRMFKAANILGVPGPWFFEDLVTSVVDKRDGVTQYESQVVELKGLLGRVPDDGRSAELKENARKRLDLIYERLNG
jgi:transcriptional regulator with XRE-family HTH domain